MTNYQEILDFWFKELNPDQHFTADDQLDQEIAHRFGQIHTAARQSQLYAWRDNLDSALAEIIILDQFSRNLFRGNWRSYSQDGMALALAQQAIARFNTNQLTSQERSFLYMPYMHSESLAIHDQAMMLFSSDPGLAETLEYEVAHYKIIKAFNRYPFRNQALGRQSTPEEEDFLANFTGF
ncbi:hypothetical protein AWM75_06200 [Aerococcus urinaehominis]|uniref:Uncharacterized protein n=1 Tax=Aerococcus urinaehominis TaxID=128944 RepID=A0A109RHX5_9LACT|nr:DUF924 family protein [Aerococcus urinaehominis]AMB99596.1 hypothetical protein AWM75_06200 [Aerococcus urinaehominis]SDL86857.1 Uncharacterized conserved protein, DUF924 family [Aerococcus urinaehominis]